MRAVLAFVSTFALLGLVLFVSSREQEERVLGLEVGRLTPLPNAQDEVVGRLPLRVDIDAIPESVLVHVPSGRAFDLRESGRYRIDRPEFSSDSRYLVYGRELQDRTSPEIVEVDLTQPALRVTRLADGGMGWLASTGAFFYYREREMFVRTPHGVSYRLQPAGSIWSGVWSPDGRWLAYYGAENTATGYPLLLLDVHSGKVREVDRVIGCQCDEPTLVAWSPESDYLVYPHRGIAQTSRRIVALDGRQPAREVNSGGWADKQHYAMVAEGATAGDRSVDIYLVDIQTGEEKSVATDMRFDRLNWSPDGRWLATSLFGSNVSRNGTTVLSVDGNVRHSGLQGDFLAWSHDGRYFATHGGNATSCSVYRTAEGTPLDCNLDRVDWTGASFSPVRDEIAYLSAERHPATLSRPSTSEDLYLFDLDTGRMRMLLPDVQNYLWCVFWSPDGEWLVVTNYRSLGLSPGC
jgi:WD40 repeat protein